MPDETNQAEQPALWPLRPKEIEVPEADPFDEDILERRPSTELLTQLLRRTATPLVLGIDSAWGTGKTTFVRIWKQHLANEGFSTLYFNAWETDYVAEPLIALVGELDEVRGRRGARQSRRVKELAGQIARRGLPIATRLATGGLLTLPSEELEKGIAELFEGVVEQRIEEYDQQKKELKKFREALRDLVSKISSDLPLVFFIDELDRCRPTFAVELLERVKHLFEVPGIVFVLSMHRAQLAHSLKAVYGTEFDAEGYLGRFLDLTYALPRPSEDRYPRFLFSRFPVRPFESTLQFLMQYLDFSLRDQERCVARASVVIRAVPDRLQGHPLLPTLVVLQAWRPDLFDDFASGASSADVVLTKLEEVAPSRWKGDHESAWVEGACLALQSSRAEERPPRAGSGGTSTRFEEYKQQAQDGEEWAQEIVQATARILESSGEFFRGAKALVKAAQLSGSIRSEGLME